MDIINSSTQEARKEHICNWCNQKIQIGEVYNRSFCKEDDIYVWKNHIHCEKIASELKMFEDGPVSEDTFVENIQNEYSKLMSDHHNELYESENFELPNFKEQLYFVCRFYKIIILTI